MQSHVHFSKQGFQNHNLDLLKRNQENPISSGTKKSFKNCLQDSKLNSDYQTNEEDPIDAVYTWVNGSDPELIRTLLEYRARNRNPGNSLKDSLDTWSWEERCLSKERRSGVKRSYSSFLQILPLVLVNQEGFSFLPNSSSMATFSWIPFSDRLAQVPLLSPKQEEQKGIPEASTVGSVSVVRKEGASGYTSREEEGNSRKNQNKGSDKTALPTSSSLLYFTRGIDRRKDPFFYHFLSLIL